MCVCEKDESRRVSGICVKGVSACVYITAISQGGISNSVGKVGCEIPPLN